MLNIKFIAGRQFSALKSATAPIARALATAKETKLYSSYLRKNIKGYPKTKEKINCEKYFYRQIEAASTKGFRNCLK